MPGPSPDTLEMLAHVSVATLATALFKRGLRNQVIQDVRPVRPKGRNMVGPAFTLRYIPAREDRNTLDVFRNPEHPQRHAVETCPPGHVLVMDSRKDARGASAGDILLRRIMKRGAVGAVTDGGFRDTPAIREMGFAVYQTRASAPTGPIFHHAADFNLPIACGDVAVFPGDVMVGDGEGVICLPAHLAEELAHEAFEMTAYEDWVEEQVMAGAALPGIYPQTDRSRAAFEADRGRSRS